jgi:SAM-dependent methyltransferase
MVATYTIDGGMAGKARLDVLAAVCAPGTNELLNRVEVRAGWRCLDLGCGGGHVSRELARRVGPDGHVVGIDLDATVLSLAAADAHSAGLNNLEFSVADAAEIPASSYDLVYARCLLSHVEEPARVLAAIWDGLVPGGLVVIEDIDFSGYFCRPPLPAHDTYVRLYRETVRLRGGNADLGPTIPGLLLAVGFTVVEVSISQACGLVGDAKLIPPLTLERIASAVVAEGVAARSEVDQAVAQLYVHAAKSDTLMGMPRVVQTWGRKPETGLESPLGALAATGQLLDIADPTNSVDGPARPIAGKPVGL